MKESLGASLRGVENALNIFRENLREVVGLNGEFLGYDLSLNLKDSAKLFDHLSTAEYHLHEAMNIDLLRRRTSEISKSKD